MVVVKGKDKRRGNESDNLEVISHTKGMRSMGGPSSGRFAADMRVRVGGYGRPDQTWGVDHPWHNTKDVDLHQVISAKDRMEDGVLVEKKPEGKGMSRAALKRKKRQGKLASTVPEETPVKLTEEVTVTTTNTKKQKEPKSAKTSKLSLFDDSDDDSNDKVESKDNDEKDDEPTPPPTKKAKVETSKKKPAQAKGLSKRELQKQQRDKEDAQRDLHLLVEEKPVLTVLPVPEREALSIEYDEAFGREITTPSGLIFRDIHLGRGALPAPGQMLTVRYKGSLGKGGSVFGKGMLTVKFGQGAVIAGWEEGLATMRPSGKRFMTIPPNLAYGASGKGEKIPPSSTLYFEVELVRIGTRQRDAVGDDDVPLPKAFVRQRIKEKAKKTEEIPKPAAKAGKKRIKY